MGKRHFMADLSRKHLHHDDRIIKGLLHVAETGGDRWGPRPSPLGFGPQRPRLAQGLSLMKCAKDS